MTAEVKVENYHYDCLSSTNPSEEMVDVEVKIEYDEEFIDNNAVYDRIAFEELATLNGKNDIFEKDTKFDPDSNDEKEQIHITNFEQKDVTIMQMDIVNQKKRVNLKPKIYNCQFCDYSMASKESLKRHMDSVHLNKKPYKCEMCDFSTSRKIILKKHVDSVHLNLKPHKCHSCEYSATQKAHLKRHMESIHLKMKPYKCQLCDFSATQKGNLKMHMDSVHLKVKPYKCDSCDFAATKRVIINHHIHAAHS